MTTNNASRGVFLYDEPNLEKLKACAFFWQNIIVYESYLSHVSEYPALTEPTEALFKGGILKICDYSGNFKNNLLDKIYSNLDRTLIEYLYKNSDKITTKPDLPENADVIIKQSTKRDAQDANLRSLMDNVIYEAINEKWMNALKENGRLPYDSMPAPMKRAMISKVGKLTDLEYKHYLRNNSESRFRFEYRNECLLEQMSVSSSLYTPMSWLPYYSYKLGDYSVRDARKYLRGLNTVMPFVKRESIDKFTIDEIIKIRHNRRWNTAMIKLSELCNAVKCEANLDQFSQEISEKVVTEFQDALDQEEVTWKDLGEQVLKNSAFAGISFIPIVGPVVSTIAGFVDPIVSYFQKERAQKTLPFFLNDLRRLNSS